ncbi:hypothetical protein Emag_002643 [Eimeria magna]
MAGLRACGCAQQVGQLKEEIKAKDAGLLKQHFEHRKITTENENLKDDLSKAEKKLTSLEQIINAQKQVQVLRGGPKFDFEVSLSSENRQTFGLAAVTLGSTPASYCTFSSSVSLSLHCLQST